MYVVRIGGRTAYCGGLVFRIGKRGFVEPEANTSYTLIGENQHGLIGKYATRTMRFLEQQEAYAVAVVAAKTPEALETILSKEVAPMEQFKGLVGVKGDLKEKLLFPHYVEMTFSLFNMKPYVDGEIRTASERGSRAYSSLAYPYIPKQL
ncbi:hypothetical protein HYV82_01970 [Candidatus Woesearchaeota archaeon]|nr:hypothetical protein [Candidatus Woesearchaeota archaeon]